MGQLDVDALRLEFPIVQQMVYFNTGSAGVCPRSVFEELCEGMRVFELEGVHGWPRAAESMEVARKRLADFLSADANELAFTRNATDGVNLVIEGIEWGPGDEVLLSSEEHPAMLYPWTYLTQRRDVKLRRFKLGDSGSETLENIRAALGSETRLLATSHVSSVTGKRVPMDDIATLCASEGVMTLFDGAQATGQFPIDLTSAGVDFYTGNLHKWLHGPKGTGFLYVSGDRIDDVQPTHVGAGSGGFSEADGLTPSDSALRFEYGTRDFGKYGGLVPLFDWYERIGIDNLRSRMSHLTSYLKGRLGELEGVTVHSPSAWDESSALTTLSIPGVPAQRVFNELWEIHRVHLRVVEEVDGNRISTTFFNTEDEVDLLIRGLLSFLPAH